MPVSALRRTKISADLVHCCHKQIRIYIRPISQYNYAIKPNLISDCDFNLLHLLEDKSVITIKRNIFLLQSLFFQYQKKYKILTVWQQWFALLHMFACFPFISILNHHFTIDVSNVEYLKYSDSKRHLSIGIAIVLKLFGVSNLIQLTIIL